MGCNGLNMLNAHIALPGAKQPDRHGVDGVELWTSKSLQRLIANQSISREHSKYSKHELEGLMSLPRMSGPMGILTCTLSWSCTKSLHSSSCMCRANVGAASFLVWSHAYSFLPHPVREAYQLGKGWNNHGQTYAWKCLEYAQIRRVMMSFVYT